MEAPEMALDSCVQSAEIVMPRRKRSRSPAILIFDDEEPNNKLLRLRNMDFQLDGKNDCSTTGCSDLLQSPEYRQNGLYAEGGREPIARCRAIKKKSKCTLKRKGQRLLRMNFELLKQEMEPIQVVDYLKEKGEIFHELHRKTIGKKWRTERVETLLHGLFELMSDENEDGIFQMIIDALVQSRQTELAQELQNDTDNFLPNEIHDSNETDKTGTATSSSHESTEVKVSCEPVVTQDSSDHTDHPLSQLRELQQSVVQTINGNEGQLNELHQNIMQDCTSRLQKITFGSINLHLKSMTDESIKKLINCCKGEEVRKWIISILGKGDLETLKGLKATTFTVKVFVNDIQRENKYKMFDEVTDGCLCVVNKNSLQNNDVQFKTVIEGLEWKLINSLLEHDILSDELKDILHTTRQADELTDFLCHQNIPQVSYCFMENDVLKNDRGIFISQLRQGRPSVNDCHRMQHISKSDIKEHKTLLEEETDANWFVSSLQTKGDKTSKDLVKMIIKSSSRRTRTRKFVEYLCKVHNEEYEWFEDILQEKHQHLLEILQPKVLTNVAEVRHGLLSLYDYLIEELDPEDVCNSLKESSHEKLECAQLSLMPNKRDKCKRFLANILKKENSYLVPEVMNAMMTYKGNIYDTVQLVLAKGSLSPHYRCPRIEKESLKSSKCCFKTKISLTEDAKEDCQSDSDSDRDVTPLIGVLGSAENPRVPMEKGCQSDSDSDRDVSTLISAENPSLPIEKELMGKIQSAGKQRLPTEKELQELLQSAEKQRLAIMKEFQELFQSAEKHRLAMEKELQEKFQSAEKQLHKEVQKLLQGSKKQTLAMEKECQEWLQGSEKDGLSMKEECQEWLQGSEKERLSMKEEFKSDSESKSYEDLLAKVIPANCALLKEFEKSPLHHKDKTQTKLLQLWKEGNTEDQFGSKTILPNQATETQINLASTDISKHECTSDGGSGAVETV